MSAEIFIQIAIKALNLVYCEASHSLLPDYIQYFFS